MGRPFFAALVVAAGLCIYPGVALADQECAYGSGTFGPGAERTLGLTWTWESEWSYIDGVPYRELRYRSDGAVTFSKDIPSGYIYTAFKNCFNGTCSDAYRRTAVKNLGTKTWGWNMDQRALGAC
jgi:hypothetical protein